MLEEFLKNTCNITRKIESNDNGIVTKASQEIYSNIDCQIYQVSQGLSLTNIGENTPSDNRKIIIGPENINVRNGDFIEIIDPRFGTIGNYQIVKPPKMNEFISGDDSIQLQAKAI